MGSRISALPGLGVTSQRLRFGDGLVCEARADDLAESEEGGVGDAVEDLNTLPATRNEGGVVQSLKMAGDVGLAGSGGPDDVVHRQLSVHQALQDAQSGGVAQDGEPARHIVQHRRRHRLLLRAHRSNEMKEFDTFKHITK